MEQKIEILEREINRHKHEITSLQLVLAHTIDILIKGENPFNSYRKEQLIEWIKQILK